VFPSFASAFSGKIMPNTGNLAKQFPRGLAAPDAIVKAK
jgi:hypothetical protein